jgi:hypothetical protein
VIDKNAIVQPANAALAKIDAYNASEKKTLELRVSAVAAIKDFNGSLAESLGLLDAALAAIAQTGDASHDLAGSHTREDLPKPISDPDAAKAPEATDKPLTLGDHI